MSDLIIIGYDDLTKADKVRAELMTLQKEHLISLEDAVTVRRKQDGQVKINQAYNLTASGALSGGLWGTLIGLIFLNPLLGLVAGAAAGAVGGALTDIGINDDFIKEIGQTIQPGNSALFILVRQFTPDKVIDEIKPYGGKILRTSLSVEDETELKARLEAAAPESLRPTPQ